MSYILVHISDIHFGQEKDGKLVYVHEDARDRLIDDAKRMAESLAPKEISGVIVTGDIAYAGTAKEYDQAAEWLDNLTVAVGCDRSDVQVVPGNHDIDWDEISSGAEYLLKQIEENGEDSLNAFLGNKADRELLYNRFHAYSAFADAYNCSLDKRGGGAGDRLVELVPGRGLRLTGLNTALACSKKDQKGKLLLGERQRVLPINAGEELVVLAHHPMKWMADEKDANEYILARARVLITGHEHDPSARTIEAPGGADLLVIEAGATVPPGSEEEFTYTYNLLEFEWHEQTDSLSVQIYPRCWSEARKEFMEDTVRVPEGQRSFILASPHYKEAPNVDPAQAAAAAKQTTAPAVRQSTISAREGAHEMPEEYPDLVLKFFRDLSAAERLQLLVSADAIPADWDNRLSHGTEKLLFDKAIRHGKTATLRRGVDAIIEKKSHSKGGK